MSARRWKQQAIELIAAYDRDEADAYEDHVARIARRWLTLLNSKAPRQGTVNNLLEELRPPTPDGYGCGWEDLRKHVYAWALEDDWMDA